MAELTKEEIWVREQIADLYPQLVINCKKVLGAGYQFYGDDLLPVAIEFFLKKPIEVQVKAFKENTAENFITFIMNLQAKSGSSKFYRDYKKHSIEQREYYVGSHVYDSFIEKDESDDDLMLCLKAAMQELNPFERMLVEKRILDNVSYDEIIETYNIPYSGLANQLMKVKKKLRELCKHYR